MCPDNGEPCVIIWCKYVCMWMYRPTHDCQLPGPKLRPISGVDFALQRLSATTDNNVVMGSVGVPWSIARLDILSGRQDGSSGAASAAPSLSSSFI